MLPVVGQTFAGRFEANYAVFVHSDRAPTPAEWARVLAAMRAAPNLQAMRFLVYTEGGAPDALQRAELNQILSLGRPRIAILTKSVIARVAARAISLLANELRVFDVHQVDAALAHLQLTESEKGGARRALAELRSELARLNPGSNRPGANE